MATTVAPPVTAKTSTSVPPLYAQALAQAKAALAAQVQPIQDEQAASDANFQQQQTDATDSAAALSKLLQPIGPAVNGMYQTAAQNQELAANGFSQGMQDALKGNTDNLNAMLQKLGSPATLDSHASQAGDALYALGGFNPGRSFSQQGAAFGSAAELQSGDALLKGQENVKSLKAQALVADQGFQAKIAELAGKLPGDAETNYKQLQQFALDNKKFAQTVKNDRLVQAQRIWDRNFKVGQANEKVDEFNARQAVTEQKFARQVFQQDRTYAISLAHLGIAQKAQQLKVAAQEYKLQNGGFSATQIARYNGQIQTTANAIHKVVAPDGSEQFFVPKNKAEATAGKATLPISYSDFVRQAVAKGAPLSLVIERANKIFPLTQRPTPEVLAAATGLTQKAAAAADNYTQLQADRNQAVGAFNSKGQAILATSPKTGQKVMLQMPVGLRPQAKAVLGKMLNLAVDYMGTPYAWGGESPTGFDCSGLAQYVYAQSGITIPRTTYDQFKGGLPVPKNQLQAGDLVFFQGTDAKNGLPGHVGIYIGNGKMIQAPHTGDVVKVSSVSGFPGYAGARRYVH